MKGEPAGKNLAEEIRQYFIPDFRNFASSYLAVTALTRLLKRAL
jgi:hypothetical protein